MRPGPQYLGNHHCRFTVWGPHLTSVAIHFNDSSQREPISLAPVKNGFWHIEVAEIAPWTQYQFLLNGTTMRPDPASPFQPKGPHGPSSVVDHGAFCWSPQDHAWAGRPLSQCLLYELHIGTFTEEGTFLSAINRLDYLVELGINAIEIMPIAQFPGERNWGYDGTYPYAPQNSYGGPTGFKKFIDACHCRDIAVVLDVVYNHLGPEGNYLGDYGPYFTSKYQTPWGCAINYDGAWSDAVRAFFIENALYWMRDYHVDGLRLDAVHAIYDGSALPFLQELQEAVETLEKQVGKYKFLLAESDLNDARLLRPRSQGGYQLSGQWCDDFHHALHVCVTGENQSYYQDFGSLTDLATSLQQAYVYDGQYMPSRQRRHGQPPQDRPSSQFCVFAQNHDQIGNRAYGERLSDLIPFDALKLVAATVLLSPYVPLLFMGEEWGEKAPFMYFISHTDPTLIRNVQKGRQREFRELHTLRPSQKFPDPSSEETFYDSKLHWESLTKDSHRVLWEWHQRLIAVRQACPFFHRLDQATPHQRHVSVDEEKQVLLLFMGENPSEPETISLFHFSSSTTTSITPPPFPLYCKSIDSAEKKEEGSGVSLPKQIGRDSTPWLLAPYHFAFFQKPVSGKTITL